MGIEIKNKDAIVKAVGARLEQYRERFPQAIQLEKTEILKNVQQGKDPDGAPLKPYSPSYAKFRAKKGRKTSPVDLTFTGRMLGAMTTAVRQVGNKLVGTIGFDNSVLAKVRGNLKLRPFFGLSDEGLKRIHEYITKKG